MSNRRDRIRGPQSALTDFLAANNISASRIRDTFEERQRAAALQNGNEANGEAANGSTVEQGNDNDQEPSSAGEGPSGPRKRRRAASSEGKSKKDVKELDDSDEEDDVVDPKSKRRKLEEQKKKAKKGKKGKKKGSDDDFSDSDNDILGRDMYKKAQKMPGQLENCDVCNKRFTVTPYSKPGPEGGLLCTPCGKQLAKDEKAASKQTPKGGQGKKRRQVESNRLDGLARYGSKSLTDMCINLVAKHHGDVEELGDLPGVLLDKLSQIFSKKRVLDPRTLQFFLRPDVDTVAIHDAAKLETNDFRQMFAVTPNLTKLILRNAGQLKDTVIDYIIEKTSNITFFQVYGANLVTDDTWIRFFIGYGHRLQTIKIQDCDASFTDDVVRTIADYCPNLERLKLKTCRKVTDKCIPDLAKLGKLEHLSVQFSQPTQTDLLIPLVEALGPQLKTLSLEDTSEATDPFLTSIASRCSSLSKFRITNNAAFTDRALASLFSPDTAIPPLTFLDLSSNRSCDNNNPGGPENEPIGVNASSLLALMSHSGANLRYLDLSSCRHIPHSAFCDVFAPTQGNVYPRLETLNLSFCQSVDSSVVSGIFATCRAISKIIAFGCFSVGEVVVPRGVAVIGVPRAQDAIENVGDANMSLGRALKLGGAPKAGRLVDAAAA
ncbi:MAG: hypothetical protein M1828_003984 [Chrysothrix sp. TS-e1954]|nr:MAG: hypothetical protein M1828_003984 [Chrysothrix sp. TS-e1954]